MKSIIDPLLWIVVFQIIGLVALQRYLAGRGRLLLWLLLFLNLFQAIVSTPLATRGLEASLWMPSTNKDLTTPDCLFVLSGGYLPGATSGEDILVEESQRRVLHAITIWKRYPNARMVFSGASYQYGGIRDSGRNVELMAEVAMNHGVPLSALLLEPHSCNTREHPIEALKLPGLTPETPVGIVTSSWHMRRAMREFRRSFKRVLVYPVAGITRPTSWNDLVPDADALSTNTTLLREWVGFVWYAIISLKGESQGKEPLWRP